jgi:hypothetical protein
VWDLPPQQEDKDGKPAFVALMAEARLGRSGRARAEQARTRLEIAFYLNDLGEFYI